MKLHKLCNPTIGTSSTAVNINIVNDGASEREKRKHTHTKQIALVKRVSISIVVNDGVACVTFVVGRISNSFRP